MKRVILAPLISLVFLVGGLTACSSDKDDGASGDGDGDGMGNGSGDGDSGDGDTVDRDDLSSGGTSSGGTSGEGTGGDDAGSGSGGSDPTDPFDQARIDCVDRINAFRATEGKPALTRWTEAESCTDSQSQKDADGGGAHANFGDCGEFAQNTCPGWGDIDSVIQGCLQSMWDEGPGEPFSEHGHYINMSSTQYTTVACGFYVMPNGDIWHNHNFK